MSGWADWDEKPPRECTAALMAGKEPFAVGAVWLHLNTHELIKRVGPFMVRAARDAQPGMPMERVVRVILAPMIDVIFREWIVTQPPEQRADLVVQAFCQTVADLVLAQATQAKPQKPS